MASVEYFAITPRFTLIQRDSALRIRSFGQIHLFKNYLILFVMAWKTLQNFSVGLRGCIADEGKQIDDIIFGKKIDLEMTNSVFFLW